MTLVPLASGIEATDHVVVPLAWPLPPRSLTHVTSDTLLLSDAVPLNGIDVDVVLYVFAFVGPVIVTLGGVVSATGAVVIVHVKGCDDDNVPSDADATTEYVPVVVP
jgi:hypothetical protein